MIRKTNVNFADGSQENDDSEKREAEIGEEIFGDAIFPSPENQNDLPSNEPFTNIGRNDTMDLTTEASISESLRDQNEKTNEDPGLASGDLDADWSTPNTTGEEQSLGSVETPDQSVVDQISRPWGEEYDDSEEIDVLRKNRRLEQDREKDVDKNLESR